MFGPHSVSDQHAPITGGLQTLFTHGTNILSPQSRSLLQQPGASAHPYWPPVLSQAHVHAPICSVPAGAPLHVAQSRDSQLPAQARLGAQDHPLLQTSQGNGAPEHVPAGQSSTGTVPGGQTQTPSWQMDESNASEPQP
jgi:hypothetical protein